MRDGETKLLFLLLAAVSEFYIIYMSRAENKSRPGVEMNLTECDVFCV